MYIFEKKDLSKSNIYNFLPKYEPLCEKVYSKEIQKQLIKIAINYGIAKKPAKELFNKLKKSYYNEYSVSVFTGIYYAIRLFLKEENIELREKLAYNYFKILNNKKILNKIEKIVESKMNIKFYRCEKIDIEKDIINEVQRVVLIYINKIEEGNSEKNIKQILKELGLEN